MKVLACLPTYGVGTPYVESFSSVVRRTAEAYDVGFHHVVPLLGRIADRKPRAIYKGYLRGSFLNGWLPVTKVLTESMDRLTGRQGYDRHTLLKLAGVLGTNSRGFFDLGVRWCPICLDAEMGVEYELLAHSITGIARCPLHGATLLNACLACGTKRSFRTDGPLQRTCRHCGDALSLQRLQYPPRDHHAEWKEQQILKLISYCSDESQPPPAADWSAKLRGGHAILGWNRDRLYSHSERRVFRNIATGFGRIEPNSLFHFAAIQSVDVVDLLLQPEACCSPRLPDLTHVRKHDKPRQTRKPQVEAAKSALEALLLTEETQELPGLRVVCRDNGTDSSALYQYFPETYRAYGIERRRRQQLQVSYALERSVVAAKEILRQDATLRLPVRALGKLVSNKVGAPKHIAEEAARRVIRESA